MNQIIKKSALSLIFSCVLLLSCKEYSQKQINKETATRGDIKIAVDEAYTLLADSEIAVFENMYRYAKVTPISASEDSVLQLFLADSVRLMITSRKLTTNEEAYLKDQLIIPRTTQIAFDGLAFVVNIQNPDNKIRYNTIMDMLAGKVTSWKQINRQSKLGNVQIVFDNQGSSNVRFLMSKFELTSLPEYCYSAGSNPSVIDYVEANPEAIGIISVNWISDPDDSITHAFLSRVKVVGITPEVFSEGSDFFTPHPAYIADKSYPFIREVYAISRETKTGLGKGFIAFMAADQGQRIVLKMGMVPATMPIRLVHLRSE
ncbi:MAG TPA: substrate-binding domain-containing protein [Bacteroidales bacterium]|nr:substrate-binding domain-containing protein [Bacteroidales bacterium]